MSKYLILISVDALNSKDYPIIRRLSAFRTLIERGAFFPVVNSIYPSLTYPCHTSIITGRYPEEHGIFNNEIPCPEKGALQDWFWYEKDIQATTLFDAAYATGLKSAAVLYPVMAGSKTITYNFPEIFSNTGESQLSLFLKTGSLSLLPMALRHASKARGKSQPYLDNFSFSLFKDILKKKKPHLSALHLTELDDARHHHGTFSEEAKKALISANNKIAEIIALTKKMGIFEETAFAVFGDHGFQDYDKVISFQRLLQEAGLLELNEKNQIVSWQVFSASACGSLQLYLKDPDNLVLQSKTELFLQSLLDHPEKPIKAIFTREEVKQKYHLDGNFSYVLEANDGFAFEQDVYEKGIIPISEIPNSYCANHGFLPSQPNLHTALMIMGPEIKPGVHPEAISLLDHAPTFAKILGLPWDTRPALDIFI